MLSFTDTCKTANINFINLRPSISYNTQFLYYIHGPRVDKINFCRFACVTEQWALQIVIKWQFFTHICSLFIKHIIKAAWHMANAFLFCCCAFHDTHAPSE